MASMLIVDDDLYLRKLVLTYAQLEHIWDEYNVYEKAEDESFHG